MPHTGQIVVPGSFSTRQNGHFILALERSVSHTLHFCVPSGFSAVHIGHINLGGPDAEAPEAPEAPESPEEGPGAEGAGRYTEGAGRDAEGTEDVELPRVAVHSLQLAALAGFLV